MIRVLCGVAVMLSAYPAAARPGQVGGTGTLSVDADVDSAYVVVDGVPAGRTPLVIDSVAAGSHAMRILHPDLANWNAPVIEDTVLIPEDGVITRVYRFEHRIMMSSVPSGADVVVSGRVVGRTPLAVSRADADTVRLRVAGYRTAVIPLARAERGHILFTLQPDPGGEAPPDVLIADGNGAKSLPLVLSGVSSVIAGGFSAYFKVQADRAYGEYLLSGDPVKLAQTRKLDNVAGIALGASQLYFALFSYLLLTQ